MVRPCAHLMDLRSNRRSCRVLQCFSHRSPQYLAIRPCSSMVVSSICTVIVDHAGLFCIFLIDLHCNRRSSRALLCFATPLFTNSCASSLKPLFSQVRTCSLAILLRLVRVQRGRVLAAVFSTDALYIKRAMPSMRFFEDRS